MTKIKIIISLFLFLTVGLAYVFYAYVIVGKTVFYSQEDGWEYEVIAHCLVSDKGHLRYRGIDWDPSKYGYYVMCALGEFVFSLSEDQYDEFSRWRKISDQTTFSLPLVEESISSVELDQGFYHVQVPSKKIGTPETWVLVKGGPEKSLYMIDPSKSISGIW